MKARIPDSKSWSEKMREIEKLMEHPLNADDGFSFRCKQCGECCKNRNDILLSPFDICRIAEQLKKLPEEVISEYGFVYIGQTSQIPLVSLRMRPDNNECPFLNKNRCGIHMGKPAACALFPLGRFAIRDDPQNIKVAYILQSTDCGTKDERHTPREWMNSFNLEESENYFYTWQNTVMEISERLKKIIDDIPPRVQDMMYNQMTHFLYACYNIGEPIIPQLERNKMLTDRFLDVIEEKISEFKQ